jgi:hypothetical protein
MSKNAAGFSQLWAYPFQNLWSNPLNSDISNLSPALQYFLTMQWQPTEPVIVSGQTLKDQMIVKTIYTGAVGNYTLDAVDAYNLNYYGLYI